jgi:hypothetical protein
VAAISRILAISRVRPNELVNLRLGAILYRVEERFGLEPDARAKVASELAEQAGFELADIEDTFVYQNHIVLNPTYGILE